MTSVPGKNKEGQQCVSNDAIVPFVEAEIVEAVLRRCNEAANGSRETVILARRAGQLGRRDAPGTIGKTIRRKRDSCAAEAGFVLGGSGIHARRKRDSCAAHRVITGPSQRRSSRRCRAKLADRARPLAL